MEEIELLNPLIKEELEPLYLALKNIVIPKHTGVKKFGPSKKRMSFGRVFRLREKNWGEAVANQKFPQIYELLKDLGNKICPFVFTAIQVNHNVICPPHTDSGNKIDKSVIISFGEYEGCKLLIAGNEYDTYLQPIIFNGKILEHWNSDDLVGNKYSIVYYQ
jgi:hypothetical protein